MFLRIFIPTVLVFTAGYAGYMAAFCGWAATAPSHDDDAWYSAWCNIYTSLFFALAILAGLTIYGLRRKKRNFTEPSAAGNSRRAGQLTGL
jgi:hypothetical protein